MKIHGRYLFIIGSWFNIQFELILKWLDCNVILFLLFLYKINVELYDFHLNNMKKYLHDCFVVTDKLILL